MHSSLFHNLPVKVIAQLSVFCFYKIPLLFHSYFGDEEIRGKIVQSKIFIIQVILLEKKIITPFKSDIANEMTCYS